MARNAQVTMTKGQWTQITNDEDASGDMSIELQSDVALSLQATADGTTPTDDWGPLELLSWGDGWSEATIAEKFPGVSGAVRLWGKPLLNNRDSKVGVSYG